MQESRIDERSILPVPEPSSYFVVLSSGHFRQPQQN